MTLYETRDALIQAFEAWLQANPWLFEDGTDPRKQKKKQAELKKLRKIIEEMRSNPSFPRLLGFTLWCQNYIANFGGAMFGMGIHGNPVKSFYTTDPRTDVPSSERLAQAMAAVLHLQLE
jgi:hypothetical protein